MSTFLPTKIIIVDAFSQTEWDAFIHTGFAYGTFDLMVAGFIHSESASTGYVQLDNCEADMAAAVKIANGLITQCLGGYDNAADFDGSVEIKVKARDKATTLMTPTSGLDLNGGHLVAVGLFDEVKGTIAAINKIKLTCLPDLTGGAEPIWNVTGKAKKLSPQYDYSNNPTGCYLYAKYSDPL